MANTLFTSLRGCKALDSPLPASAGKEGIATNDCNCKKPRCPETDPRRVGRISLCSKTRQITGTGFYRVGGRGNRDVLGIESHFPDPTAADRVKEIIRKCGQAHCRRVRVGRNAMPAVQAWLIRWNMTRLRRAGRTMIVRGQGRESLSVDPKPVAVPRWEPRWIFEVTGNFASQFVSTIPTRLGCGGG